MILRVVLSSGIDRDTKSLPSRDLVRVIEAIRRFAETGQGNIDTMKGHPGEYRLRVGDYRVRFAMDVVRGEMVVLRIAHRREVYRQG